MRFLILILLLISVVYTFKIKQASIDSEIDTEMHCDDDEDGEENRLQQNRRPKW